MDRKIDSNSTNNRQEVKKQISDTRLKEPVLENRIAEAGQKS